MSVSKRHRGSDSFSKENNPHIAQYPSCTPFISTMLPRILTSDAPRMSYRRRAGERKSVVHWGQRKLLLSEIEFLTHFAQSATTVIYAGAAPGTHIPYLSYLFPHLHFVLVDAAPFAISATSNITLHQHFMTEEFCEQYATQECLFICDIRSVDAYVSSPAVVEAAVAYDMQLQQRYVELLSPAAAILKFRLPYASGTSTYLKGELRFPIWGPPTTTETRLIVTPVTDNDRKVFPKTDYCNTSYNEQMFYFNTETRVHLYKQQDDCSVIESSFGIDHCYDCSAEIFVLRQYVEKCNCDDNRIESIVASMIEHISIACGGGLSRNRNKLLGCSNRNIYEHRVYDVLNQRIQYIVPTAAGDTMTDS